MRCLVVSNYRHKLCLAFFFVMIREKTKQKKNKTKQKQKVIFFRTFRVKLAFRRRKKLNRGWRKFAAYFHNNFHNKFLH